MTIQSGVYDVINNNKSTSGLSEKKETQKVITPKNIITSEDLFDEK